MIFNSTEYPSFIILLCFYTLRVLWNHIYVKNRMSAFFVLVCTNSSARMQIQHPGEVTGRYTSKIHIQALVHLPGCRYTELSVCDTEKRQDIEVRMCSSRDDQSEEGWVIPWKSKCQNSVTQSSRWFAPS